MCNAQTKYRQKIVENAKTGDAQAVKNMMITSEHGVRHIITRKAKLLSEYDDIDIA